MSWSTSSRNPWVHWSHTIAGRTLSRHASAVRCLLATDARAYPRARTPAPERSPVLSSRPPDNSSLQMAATYLQVRGGHKLLHTGTIALCGAGAMAAYGQQLASAQVSSAPVNSAPATSAQATGLQTATTQARATKTATAKTAIAKPIAADQLCAAG